MTRHIFCGFGFGPIQAGLFVKEAYQSGRFDRIVVAEVDQRLVAAVRANKGNYWVNVAANNGMEMVEVKAVELLNPQVEEDRALLVSVLKEATEVVTSLPSVDFYDLGDRSNVAGLLAEGLVDSKAEATLVYTAENNNHAAEILQQRVQQKAGEIDLGRVQFLNTVIGKMSRVVDDPAEVHQLELVPITPHLERAFLVEQFNQILVTRCQLAGWRPGIEVFIEKENLLPFEEAKLYGHNAIHALLAFLGQLKGYVRMTELKEDAAVMAAAWRAFVDESGAALITKYGHLGEELFTEDGYRRYAEDLLQRMTNPNLADTVARAGRDVVRKLGLSDRIFGAMQLALERGIEPRWMAVGALAGVAVLIGSAEQYNMPQRLRCSHWHQLDGQTIGEILQWVWAGQSSRFEADLIRCTEQARDRLVELVG